ncbi:DNA topoisomerase [Mortierella sp. NVP85]|nr:DNA topoisomerase [Mortierella sp. NVP85]
MMAHVVMTSVRGHLMGTDFPQRYRKWHSCAPVQLFDLEIEKTTTKDLEAVERNLVQESRLADQLMIWTDCDREGEHIGVQIADVCRRQNARLTVCRARFSSVTPGEVHRAMRNPVLLDMRQAAAVDARMELDLRIGAIFTRFQTLSVQNQFPELGEGLISYGPCQFPTLGFVVDQYRRVESFIPETFWKLEMKYNKDGLDTVFTWQRGHLFDQLACLIIYEACLETVGPKAVITKARPQPTTKYRPLPLTTVELQKSGSKFLSIPSDVIMTVAENLYTKGWISYPRTETDQFDPNYDLMSLIEKQTHNNQWGRFAQRLVEGGYRNPRKGKNNDQAHPPIHPVMHTENLDGNEKKVYEFISRRFLACCAEDAKGDQTDVEARIHTETFKATGLIIKERNYLEVYPYDKWSGVVLPDFVEGEEFIPTEFSMKTGATSPPTLLTESQLIALMDKNGIGTDATIADHIKTVINREYVVRSKRDKEYVFTPSTLGIALIEGYDNFGLDISLSKPFIRSQLENNLRLICSGSKSKEEVVQESINKYREVFEIVNRDKRVLLESIGRYLGGPANGAPPPPRPPPPPPPPSSSSSSSGYFGSTFTRESNGQGPARSTWSEANHGLNSENVSGGSVFHPQPARNTPAAGTATATTCNCEGHPAAVERRVTKEGPNQGRMFYTCAKPREQQCGFFAFVDDANASNAAPAANPPLGHQALHPQRANEAIMEAFLQNLQAGGGQENKPRCRCGLVAVEAKSIKNNGRAYWRCGKQKGCDYFKWDDELNTNHPTGSWSGGQLAQQGSTSFQTGQVCYKCHQPGHFANACTSSNSNTYTSTRQSGTQSSKTKSKSTAKRASSTRSGIAAVRVSKKARPIG